MKKKNLFRLLFCTMALGIAAVLGSCVDDNEDNGLPYLEVTPSTLAFDEQGQPLDGTAFQVRSNRPWRATVEDGKTWVRLSATEGDGDGTVEVSVPASNNNDRAKITFAVYNNYGAFLTQEVTVTQGSPMVIFNETCGTVPVSDNPLVGNYTGWVTTGSGASGVSYLGANTSVRATGKSNIGAYDGASGPNVVFFGAAPASFTVQNIALTSDQMALRLSFGANFFNGSSNVFDKTQFTVSLSGDGVTYVPLTYDINGGDQVDPYWAFATANFTLSAPSAKLYIKYQANIASAFRLDDITLQTGNGGQIIDLGGGSGDAVVITIPEINAMMTSTQKPLDATQDRYVEGVVMNDVAGGNYAFNNLIISTEGSTATGSGVTLYGSQVEPSALSLTMGDKVKITLKKGLAMVVNYNGMFEITGAQTATWCTVEKTGTAAIAVATITPDQLASYQGMAVSIQNATTSQSGVWANNDALSKYTLTSGSTPFEVFFKKGATAFVDKPFRATTGTITGLAGVNNNTAQLVPRNAADVAAFDSAAPTISDVDPASLTWLATETDARVLTVSGVNLDGATLTATSSAATSAFTVAVNGLTVTVTPKAANIGTTDITETLTIAVTGGNSKELTLKQLAPGQSGGFSVISTLSALQAGTYYMAGFRAQGEAQSGSTTAPNPAVEAYYGVWTGALSSKDLQTLKMTYISNQLTSIDTDTSLAPAFMELVAVAGKTDTYYIMIGGQYLNGGDGSRSLTLGTEQAEWVFAMVTKGTESRLVASHTTAASKTTTLQTVDNSGAALIRNYASATQGAHGLYFFKKN